MFDNTDLQRATKSWTAGTRSDNPSPWYQKDAPLENHMELEPLLDFLSNDDRPTIIVEERESNPRIVHRNPAFEALIDWSTDQGAFKEWLKDLVQDDPFAETIGEFCGRSWYSRPFRHAWRIMHCHEAQPDTTLRSRRFSGNAQPSTWGDGVGGGRKLIDWTRNIEPSPNPWIQFVRNYHWETTHLGSIKDWPEELRRLAVLIMSCPDPRMVYWGNGQGIVYNEAAASILGHRHPEIMGARFLDVWGEDIHARHMELVRHAIFEGKANQAYDFQAILERNGLVEETYWNIHLLPVPGPKGHTIAVLNEYTESTSSYFNEQRRQLLARINEHGSLALNLPDLWRVFLDDFGGNLGDSQYVAIYAADPGLQENYHLEGCVGVDSCSLTPTLGMGDLMSLPSLAEAFRKAKEAQQVTKLSKKTNTLPAELAIGTVEAACIMPISSMSGQQLAFIILGLNPRRPYNQEMVLFVEHLKDSISKYAAIISLPEEQRQSRRYEELNLALTQQLRITALKAEKNEETFMRMAKSAPFGMYIYSPLGEPKFVNDSYLDLISMTRIELVEKAATGLAWRDTVWHEDVEFIAKTWIDLTQAKTPTTVEYRIIAPNSETGWKWVENISFPEVDDEGRVTTVMGWIYDISHRKLTEALMAHRLEDAIENKRASERFIDMTSHEMRNPLSAILQLADEIAHSLSPPTTSVVSLQAETVETVLDAAETILLCAQHQKNIVDDVLTISKLDANLLVITPDKIDPVELIRKAMKMYEAELARAEITAVTEVQQSYTDMKLEHVMLDPSRLLQVIINLLTNAIKFTKDLPDRKISVILSASRTPPTGEDYGVTFATARLKHPMTPKSTSAEWGAGEEVYIQFAVRDTGKGLTKDEMKLLFHRFSQGNPRTYKTYGGSGLGLFISKELTELQGGQIGVQSEAGVGSTFTFFVKARRIQDEPQRATSPSLNRKRTHEGVVVTNSMGTMQGIELDHSNDASHPLHVLVVEDNAINQRVMAQQLRRMGCIVSTADHGLDALSFLTTTSFYRSSTNVPLSVVLMDLEMPVMDGLTCISRIRQYEQTGEILRHVPVIAITANARPEQINTALDAGMDDVVTKPFTIRDLLPRMRTLVKKISDEDR